ncbi:13299_t:CDS:1, partial [Acaulospora morrowiae]
MNPILDSKTHWNSTLNMLERAITMAPALSRIVRKIPELSKFGLLPQEWDMLKEISLPLKVFRKISKTLCGESYVTMPLAVSAYNLIMDDLEDLQGKGLSSVIEEAIRVSLNKLRSYYARSDSPMYA